jgi:hypothetical protein
MKQASIPCAGWGTRRARDNLAVAAGARCEVWPRGARHRLYHSIQQMQGGEFDGTLAAVPSHVRMAAWPHGRMAAWLLVFAVPQKGKAKCYEEAKSCVELEKV